MRIDAKVVYSSAMPVLQVAPLTAIAFLANGTALVVASAMLFLVLWQSSRDVDNWLMAAYFLTIIDWSGSIFAARILALLGYDARYWFYSLLIAGGLNSLALFSLVSHYAGLSGRWWVRGAIGWAIGATILGLVPLWRGHLVTGIAYPADGTVHYTFTTAATFYYVSTYVLMQSLALGCLWFFRHTRAGGLLSGGVFVAVGALAGVAIPPLRQYPLAAIGAAVCAILFARAILREKLFNPLAELNAQLADANDQLRHGQERLAEQNLRLQIEGARRDELIQELDAFAHTVAHGLKDPLTPIAGYAALLQDPELPADLRTTALQAIGDYTRTVTRIVDGLLLLATVRQSAIELVPLDMGQIVRSVCGRLDHQIRAVGAEIRVAPSWPVALGSGPWVEEIWANYLSNALKYGGKPPRIELGATANGEVHEFWVRDHGRGLSDKELTEVFTPFTRLGTRGPEGHGLGLSIVQRIAERLGGRAAVSSAGIPGDGCTFSFSLRAAGPSSR